MSPHTGLIATWIVLGLVVAFGVVVFVALWHAFRRLTQ